MASNTSSGASSSTSGAGSSNGGPSSSGVLEADSGWELVDAGVPDAAKAPDAGELPEAGMGDAGPPGDQLCRELAQATCARVLRCNPGKLALLHGDLGGCITRFATTCQARRGAAVNDLVPSYGEFSATELAKCTGLYADAGGEWSPRFQTGSDPCNLVVRGWSCSGPCANDDGCAVGTSCAPAGSAAACGTCTAVVGQDGGCVDPGSCGRGFLCDQGICRPMRQVLKGPGDGCDASADCAGEMVCFGTCRVVTQAESGGACPMLDPSVSCPLGETCGDAVCKAPPAATADPCGPVTGLACAGMNFCANVQDGGVCALRRGNGLSCADPGLGQAGPRAGRLGLRDVPARVRVHRRRLCCAGAGAPGGPLIRQEMVPLPG